jgi:N-acetylglutamate synthase-like GNAT family acetyltransferase
MAFICPGSPRARRSGSIRVMDASIAAGLRPGTHDDCPAIESLLVASGLPLDGLSADCPFTVVAVRAGRLVGCANVERYGSSALLRSVLVDAALRGTGIGRSLVETALSGAAGDATRAYLLTETAAGFFGRLGFRQTARTRVPAAVRASVEFTSACPASAIAMTRSL